MKNISQMLKNEVAQKIVLFFNENPHCIDTAKGISLWIGYDVGAVQKALDSLVKENILISYKTISMNAYAYTNNKNIIKNIEKYMEGKVSHGRKISRKIRR